MEIYYSFLSGIFSLIIILIVSGLFPFLIATLGLWAAEEYLNYSSTPRIQTMVLTLLPLITLPFAIDLAGAAFTKLTKSPHTKIIVSSGVVPVTVVEVAPGKNLYLTVEIGEDKARSRFLLKRRCDIKVNDIYNVDVTRYKFSDDPNNTVYVEMKEVETSFCGE